MGIGPEAETLLEEITASGGGTEIGPGQLRLFELESGLPTLLKVSMMFAAIGIAALAVALIETIANLAQRATSWIPWFGTSVADGIKHGVQWLTNRIGTQYNGIDQEVGYGLSQLTTEIRLLGADVFGISFALYKLTRIVGALRKVPNLAPVVKNTQTTVKSHTTKITNLTTKVVHVTEIIRRPANPLQARQIHTLHAQVTRLQTEIVALRNQQQAQPAPSSIATAAAATALGLAGLGLNTVRCEGTRSFNDALCKAGPQGLGRLTSLLGLAALFMTLPDLAKAEHAIVSEMSGLIRDYWHV